VSSKMMGPVTAAGYNRQRQRVEESKAAYMRAVRDFTNDRAGENSTGEARTADNATISAQKDLLHRKWVEDEQQLAAISIAPRPPKNCHGRVGHRFEIQWLEASARKKKNAHEIVFLGGIGENYDGDELGGGKRGPATISCNSPLGRALKGSEAGEKVTILCPGDKENVVKIISITVARLTVANAA